MGTYVLSKSFEELSMKIRDSFQKLSFKGVNLLDQYLKWLDDDKLFEYYDVIGNPFEEGGPTAETYRIDNSADDTKLTMESIYMAEFFSKELITIEKEAVKNICEINTADVKLVEIKEFFEFIDIVNAEDGIQEIINLLRQLASNRVTYHYVTEDFEPFKILQVVDEILKKYSVRAIFLLYSAWNYSNDFYWLQSTLSAIAYYIESYFYYIDDIVEDVYFCSARDKYYNVESSEIMDVVIKNVKLFVDDDKAFFNDLKSKEIPRAEQTLDGQIIINKISPSDFLHFFVFHKRLSDLEVILSASAWLRYGVAIKSVDVVAIFSQIVKKLCNQQEDELHINGFEKSILLKYNDDVQVMLSQYIGMVFEHRNYYERERQSFDPAKLEAEEKMALFLSQREDFHLQIMQDINEENIDDLLQSKRKYWDGLCFYLTEERERKFNSQFNSLINKIKSKLRSTESFQDIYETVNNELSTVFPDIASYKEILYTLSSAEYLYNQYIKDQNQRPEFDYSCISILYYMALEDILNKLIYIPYRDAILIPNISIAKTEGTGYLFKPSYYLNPGMSSFKELCEIGNLGYLFYLINKTPKFKKYIGNKFGVTNFENLKSYGYDLVNRASVNRNHAAHGGVVISYTEAYSDKKYVFDNRNISNYRGLIFKLFKLLK